MAPLTQPLQRNEKLHDSQLNALPVKANTKIFPGAIVCTDANGLAVPGADSAGLAFQGTTYKGFDNTGGANGAIPSSTNMFGAERYVEVDQVGEKEFNVAGSAPKPGDAALVVDDNTVSKDATVNNIKCGRFTRPGNEGGWFVDTARRY